MPLDFPNSPTVGTTYTGPGGVVWTFDGTKWASGASTTAFAPIGSPAFTGDPTAPTPAYGDNDTSVATTAFVQAAVAPMANNVGRNLIHNSLFNVAQRGGGPFTASVYGLDRWLFAAGGSTGSMQQYAATDFDRNGIGDEAVAMILGCVANGTAGAGDYVIPATQLTEDVHRLAGKTVTLSFYARVISGPASSKLGIDLYQNFGTGGSPSANVKLPAQAVTLSASWTRYSTTWNIPSMAGKTLGTDSNTGATVLQLWMSSGANNNTDAGGIGVQTYTLGLWGVQLEVGSVATPLEKPDPQQDLAKCQRFYSVIRIFMGAYVTTGQTYDAAAQYLVSPRASPTLTPLADTSSSFGIRTLGVIEGGIYAQASANATASGTLNVTVGVSADL